MSPDQNFRRSANFLYVLHGRGRHFDLVQTGNTPTIDAKKMSVLTAVRVRFVPKLKSPDMIAQFLTGHEPCLDQIGQVSQNGCLIKAQRDQVGGNVGVRGWRIRPLQPMNHSQPSRRGPETTVGQDLSCLGNGINLRIL